VLTGDGIGPEIVPAAVAAVDTATAAEITVLLISGVVLAP